jgi:hypothetical protein
MCRSEGAQLPATHQPVPQLCVQQQAVLPIACVCLPASRPPPPQTLLSPQAASANRPSWFPGSQFPAHLDGSLPGDHGFDPFSLGKDPAKLNW